MNQQHPLVKLRNFTCADNKLVAQMLWGMVFVLISIVGVTKEHQIDGAKLALSMKLGQEEISVLGKEAKKTGIFPKTSWEKSM